LSVGDFALELRGIGYEVSESDVECGRIVRLPYDVQSGSHAGEEITLGFVVPADYNLTCPSGPFMHPLVVPLNTSSSEPPLGAIHAADSVQPAAGFGADWEYWSRPYPGWAQSDRNARAYMRHIAHLFDLI
jgi:hypothetical protein